MTKSINSIRALEYQSIAQRYFLLSLKKATRAIEIRDCELAADWIHFAATLAWRTHPGLFYSNELETILAKIGQELTFQNINFMDLPRLNNTSSNKKKILHVLSTVYLTGGHTRLVSRWVENCKQYSTDQIHSIVITDQGENVVPNWLVTSAKNCGGECIIIPDNFTRMQKAFYLKSIAKEWADIIVLHIHPNDPIPNIAFSSMDCDIPILFYNHADHVFSIGMSISDIILDIRKSGQKVTCLERGFSDKSVLLPIPLINVTPLQNEDREGLRIEARKRLNISLNEKIILTIGSEYKFKPALGYNFLEVAKRILLTDSTIHIYAVGLPNVRLWKFLSDETKGHFHALGIIADYKMLRDYYLAADIYIEGFPFGSLTAMLDAGLYMLPIQRMHNPNAPILSGDDIALDHLILIANNEDEYKNNVVSLINTPSAIRNNLGQKIRCSILINHCGKAWVDKWLHPIMQIIESGAYKNINITQINNCQMDPKFSEKLNISLSQWQKHPIPILLDALISCTKLSRIIRFRILLYVLQDVNFRHLFPLKNLLRFSSLYTVELIMTFLPSQRHNDLRNYISKIRKIVK